MLELDILLEFFSAHCFMEVPSKIGVQLCRIVLRRHAKTTMRKIIASSTDFFKLTVISQAFIRSKFLFSLIPVYKKYLHYALD